MGSLSAAYDSNSFLIINRIQIRITTSATSASLYYRVQRYVTGNPRGTDCTIEC